MSTKNKNIKTYDLNSVFNEYMIFLSDYNTQRQDVLTLDIENLKAKIEQDEKVDENTNLLQTKQEELQKVSGEPIPSIETFRAFLEANGLSTAHAEEIFKYRNNPERFEQIAYNDFRMRKMHPKRDYIIKKVVAPAAITCVGIGATIGAIAGSGLVGGSTVMGFIPVSGTPGLTQMATTMTGAVAGLAATPVVIKGKNLITRTYYKLKAKSAVRNLDEYTNGIDIENLNISRLVSKIQETERVILDASAPKRLVLKVINRNRIHQVEAYTKELFEKYMEIESDKTISKKVKEEALKPMYELLEQIEDFISDDVSESKIHALLTCKEDKKNHSHTYMIENIDIYANLKIYIDRLAKINQGKLSRKELLKGAKKTTKNLGQKKFEAYKILKGEKIITSKLGETIAPQEGQSKPLNIPEPKNKEEILEEFDNIDESDDFEEINDITGSTGKEQYEADQPIELNPSLYVVNDFEDLGTDYSTDEEIELNIKQPENTSSVDQTPEVTVISYNINDEAITLELEDGKFITLPVAGIDYSAIDTAGESENSYFITYADGSKITINKLTLADHQNTNPPTNTQVASNPTVDNDGLNHVGNEQPKKTSSFAPTPEVKVEAVTVEADGTVYLDLENGKEIKIPANSGIDTNKDIETAKEGKSKYSITYADGTKQEIMKKAKVLPEIETARSVLGSLLLDENFVANLIAEGYKSITITSLKEKLTEWLDSPTQKLVLSGKVKELYNYAIGRINADAKDQMNLEV